MGEQKHTEGRLTTRPALAPDADGEFDYALVDDTGAVIGEVFVRAARTDPPDGCELRPAGANARRAVACWNYCVGFPTEFLEAVATPREG